jgi:3-oxoacyl-[acyl-carrier protein] reductase
MNQVALITGGSRGLGKAFAFALASRGMRVAIAARGVQDLTSVVSALTTEGRDAIGIPTDVTDAIAVQDMICRTEQELGPIDLLINKAGVGTPFGPTWETDADEWWRNIEVNLRGPLLCCRAVINGMVARGRGRIINVASAAGTVSVRIGPRM